jgi:hypothetical protein
VGTLSVTLREEHRLRVFEKKVLRMIFGPKRDEVMGRKFSSGCTTCGHLSSIQLHRVSQRGRQKNVNYHVVNKNNYILVVIA